MAAVVLAEGIVLNGEAAVSLVEVLHVSPRGVRCDRYDLRGGDTRGRCILQERNAALESGSRNSTNACAALVPLVE